MISQQSSRTQKEVICEMGGIIEEQILTSERQRQNNKDQITTSQHSQNKKQKHRNSYKNRNQEQSISNFNRSTQDQDSSSSQQQQKNIIAAISKRQYVKYTLIVLITILGVYFIWSINSELKENEEIEGNIKRDDNQEMIKEIKDDDMGNGARKEQIIKNNDEASVVNKNLEKVKQQNTNVQQKTKTIENNQKDSDSIENLDSNSNQNQNQQQSQKQKYLKSFQYYDLIRLKTQAAYCLDGSPANYYISKTGNQENVYIYFQEGGWCADDSERNTLESCAFRSKSGYGSSKMYYDQKVRSEGILSNHPDNNFRSWKKVIFKYCDGAGHQGYRKDPIKYFDSQIYFRGHNITIQRLQDLQKRIGLFSKAKNIVVGGFSAGGVAALQWVNYVSDKAKNAKVRGLADSGIFYDSINVNTQKYSFKQSLANLFKLSNRDIDPPVPQCIQKFPNSKQSCMFVQNFYQDIKVPFFVAQSLYDTWSINYIVGLPCSRNPNEKICIENKSKVDDYRTKVINLLKQIGNNHKNGVFAISCYKHGLTVYADYYNSLYRIPQKSQYSASKSVSEWLSNKSQNNIHIDSEQWPNNKPCSDEFY